MALGAIPGHVAGFTGETDLHTFGYNNKHYSHSKEFRSNIVDEIEYWKQVVRDFDVSHNFEDEEE